jgi:hypothetical protein
MKVIADPPFANKMPRVNAKSSHMPTQCLQPLNLFSPMPEELRPIESLSKEKSLSIQ